MAEAQLKVDLPGERHTKVNLEAPFMVGSHQVSGQNVLISQQLKQGFVFSASRGNQVITYQWVQPVTFKLAPHMKESE